MRDVEAVLCVPDVRQLTTLFGVVGVSLVEERPVVRPELLGPVSPGVSGLSSKLTLKCTCSRFKRPDFDLG